MDGDGQGRDLAPLFEASVFLYPSRGCAAEADRHRNCNAEDWTHLPQVQSSSRRPDRRMAERSDATGQGDMVCAAPLWASVAACGIKLKGKPALASRRAVNVATATLPSPRAKGGFLHPLPLTARSMATFPRQIPPIIARTRNRATTAASDNPLRPHRRLCLARPTPDPSGLFRPTRYKLFRISIVARTRFRHYRPKLPSCCCK